LHGGNVFRRLAPRETAEKPVFAGDRRVWSGGCIPHTARCGAVVAHTSIHHVLVGRGAFFKRGFSMARPGSDFPDPHMMTPTGPDGFGGRALMTTPAPAMAAPAGFGTRGPEILSGGFNQTWLVNCLRRRWLLATLMGLLMAASAAGLLMWLFPESSRITSYLEVSSEDETDPFSQNKRMLSPLEITREAQTHLALIRSQRVLDAALKRQDIANLDAVQYHKGEEVLWLLNELKVAFASDSPILEVRYDGDEDPAQMCQVIDAVVQSYKDNVLMTDQTQQVATQDDLKIVLGQVKRELEKKLDELKQMAEVEDYVNFEEVELPRLRANITTYQNQLNEVEEELTEIEVLKEVSLQAARSTTALEQAVAYEIDKDPQIRLYQEQLFALKMQIQQLESSTRNPQNATLMRYQAQYQEMGQALDAYRSQAEKEARERLSKAPNEALRAAIAEYNVRKEAALAKKTEVEQKMQEAEDRIAEMSVGDPKVAMLQADIESQQELIRSLEQNIMEWQVKSRAQQQRPREQGADNEYDKVKVIQRALATEQINKYERWAIAGIGGMGALALTCYTVALLEFRRRRLNGPQDMDEGLGIRVLGVLPPTTLKALAGNSLVSAQVAEAIDNVRATIMHDSTKRARQVVMVTSPATMEGSTTVAASLALSLARAGRRTLLVDGDLRAPALHRLFGLPQEDGLSEVLRSEMDLADAVRPTSSEGLYLLTAGVCDMDAIHALATDVPQAIFDKLRDQFDFVVIDSPPVLGISDALALGQYIDGAVLTVLRDHSEIRRVYQAAETLKAMGVRLIGCVVNGVPVKADRRIVRLHQTSSSRTPRLPAKKDEPADLTDLSDLTEE
jgi:polysaccharide biosynthesis transport protein